MFLPFNSANYNYNDIKEGGKLLLKRVVDKRLFTCCLDVALSRLTNKLQDLGDTARTGNIAAHLFNFDFSYILLFL